MSRDTSFLGRIIAFNVGLAEELGSIPAAVVFHHLDWSTSANSRGWQPIKTDPEGWFTMRMATLEEQTSLGQKQLRNAREVLEAHGLIETRVIGIPPALQWRFVEDGWAALVDSAMDRRNLALSAESISGSANPAERAELDSALSAITCAPKGQKRGALSAESSSSLRVLREKKETGAASAAPEASQPSLLASNPTPASLTVAQVVAGEADDIPPGPTRVAALAAAYEALQAVWVARWKPRGQKWQETNARQWAKWAKAKRKPSELARVIVGMGFDPFEGRKQASTWNYADRAHNEEAFLEFYQRFVVAGEKPPERPVPGCKLWRDVWVPENFTPTPTDLDYHTAQQQVFIIATATWSDPAWPQGRETIANQDAKHGRPINHPRNISAANVADIAARAARKAP